MQEQVLLVILGALAFLPPLLFALWVRNSERHEREPLYYVLGLFAFAGTLGIVLTLLIHELFFSGLVALSAVIIAPLVEELTKGLGLSFVRSQIHEPEDGIVYGAALGLGFGATENFLYAWSALANDGASAAITVAIARIFSSTLLHASSSALLGFGVAMIVLGQRRIWQLVAFYLVAVILHGLYNFLVLSNNWLGFSSGIGMVIVLSVVMRQGVRSLDGRTPARAADS